MMSDNEQENEKHETVADIVAEMHKESKKVRTVTRPDGYGGYEEITLEGNTYLKNLADRIEEAWEREREELDKRISYLEAYAKLWTGRADELRLKCDEFYAKAKPVGNAAEMREALVKCREIALQWQADEADGVAGTTDKPQARSAAEAVIDMEFEINAALSAPARNCDMFKTGKEAKYRFLQIAELPEGNGDADMREWYRKLIAWLLAPATERKGECDGR